MLPIRGVWLTNVDSAILQSAQSIQQSIQQLADMGINTLFPVVWNRSYTLYPSRVMGQYFGEGARSTEIAPAFIGRDPLQEIVEAAHPLGLQVVPWFEYGFASSYRQNGGRILARYPEWAGRDRHNALLTKNGFEWLNALDIDVQDFILQLMLEVLTQYPVAGVQGDDRLPGFPVEGGYDPKTKADYYQDNGIDPPENPRQKDWMKWRSDRLTQFLQRLHHHVKAVRAEAILSIAPSPYPFGYQEYLQDYPRWLQEGAVDWIHPQLYRRSPEDYQRMLNRMLHDCGSINPERSLVIAPGMLVKSGAYLISNQDLMQCLRYNRQNQLPGEIFFFAEAFLQNQNTLALFLKEQGYGSDRLSSSQYQQSHWLRKLHRIFAPNR